MLLDILGLQEIISEDKSIKLHRLSSGANILFFFFFGIAFKAGRSSENACFVHSHSKGTSTQMDRSELQQG